MCIENILDKASPNVFIAYPNLASIIEQKERKATTLQERLM